ncbi:MAG TPA: DUF2231 domain-containing protein [Actinopolymorphaceae bacterium]|jgi:hypothetical protein
MGTFNGLPLHPLVVHAVVVLVPLTVLAAILFAVLPKQRWLFRWPLAAGAIVSAAVSFVAKRSGLKLQVAFANLPLVKIHASRANVLVLLVYAFAIVALIAVFTLGGRSQLASGALARAAVGGRAVQIAIAGVLVVIAVVVAIQVARVGDAGARAAWSGVKLG